MDRWAYILQKIGEYELVKRDSFDKPGEFYSFRSLSNIARDLEITQPHTHNVVDELIRLRWVESQKKGRCRIYNLTKEGRDINKNTVPVLLELKKKMEEEHNNEQDGDQ